MTPAIRHSRPTDWKEAHVRTMIFVISFAIASLMITYTASAKSKCDQPLAPFEHTTGWDRSPGAICWDDDWRVFEFGDRVWVNRSGGIDNNGMDKNGYVLPHKFDPSGRNPDSFVPAVVIAVEWPGSIPYYTIAIQTPSGEPLIRFVNRVIPEQAVMLVDWEGTGRPTTRP